MLPVRSVNYDTEAKRKRKIWWSPSKISLVQWVSFRELLQLSLSSYIYIVYILFVIVFFRFFSTHGTHQYSHIDRQSIPEYLYEAVSPGLMNNNKARCNYTHVLESTKTLDPKEVHKAQDILAGGLVTASYVPESCQPRFSVAILVTYRNRQRHLDVFLPYMHNFLRKQNLHYRIYLLEQQDRKPLNRGLLYNIGAKVAIADGFPCLVLHDVDLLPLDEGNLYACAIQPRHLSAGVDSLRYRLPYPTIAGGVLAITSRQYVMVDGFSNRFEGWGGEDDDFSDRIHNHNLSIIRFPPSMSRYTMLPHRPGRRNPARYRVLRENRRRKDREGFSSTDYFSVELTTQPMFTLVGVLV